MKSEILFKISKKDKTAFKCVFDTYYKSICLFIQKFKLGIEQAEDIAQDVFIKIWEREIFFPNEVALRTYLYQAAKNAALNAVEHEAVKKKYKEKVNCDLTSDEFFFQNYIEQETSRLMLKIIDELPPQAKKILYLNLEGFKNQEIADQLEISVNTVRSHKVAAYKFLKKHLKDLILLILSVLINYK